MTEFKSLKGVFIFNFFRNILLYRKRCFHESQRKTLRLRFANPRMSRCSRQQMLFKIGVLQNFVNFTGKHLCWSHYLIKLQA